MPHPRIHVKLDGDTCVLQHPVGLRILRRYGLFILTITKNRFLAGAIIIITGLCYAPIFPTTVGVTFSRFNPSLYGSVYAIMVAIGLLGPSIIPAWIGYYSKTRSIQAGYRLMVALAVLLVVFAIFL